MDSPRHFRSAGSPLRHASTCSRFIDTLERHVDGNGRTGRVLNLLYLVDRNLPDIPVLHLGRHVLRNRALYHRHPLEVTIRQAWETWTLFMLEAVRATAEWTTARIHAVRELLDGTAAAIRRKMPKIRSANWRN